jgi:thiamine-monophosphate kinase
MASSRRPPVTTGIGDDGAVLELGSDIRQVVVTDMLLDQVHFDLRTTSPRLVGKKAVAVNLSDLAAMASWPTAAFVSLAIPKQGLPDVERFLDELYAGISECCDKWEFSIAGGDTNAWNGPFAINVCLTGRPMCGKIPLRSGAKPGDRIFVTGPLGGSLSSGRHLTFEPRFDAAEWLMNNVPVTAMMDLSDGLATDLPRLAEASGVAAILDLDSIPIHPHVKVDWLGDERAKAALTDGEDFELLFTLPESETPRLHQSPPSLSFFPIGQILPGHGVELQHPNGRRQPLLLSGWQHQF